MADNTELLSELSRFNEDTLKKLITIGDSILSPMNTELLSADFASMVEQVFKPSGLADRFYPEWKDKSKSDFGRFLVELFASFSDKDFFYMNHYSKESFVGVAELYRSVFHKALHQGFKPPSNISATGNVQLIFSSGSEEFVPRGSIVLGISDLPSLVYTNEQFTIPQSTIDEDVTATFIHGKLRREQLFFDGYSLVIDVPNIVNGSVVLKITSSSVTDTWTEVDNFIGGESSDKHYMVFYSAEGKAEIMFASDDMGDIPEEGALCDVEFIIGGGYIGDIEGDTLNRVIQSQTTRNLESYTQFQMTGGNDIMNLEELRQTVIGKARTQNRVVTPEDAEYLCKTLSFVHKVFADVFLNHTYIYVLPKGGGNLDTSQQDLVEALLLQGNEGKPFLLMGYNLVVGSPIYVPITMTLTVYLLPNTIRSGANIVVAQTIDELLNPLKLGNFGEGVKRSILSSKILQRVLGSQNVVFTELRRSGTLDEPSDLEFINSELVDIASSDIHINLIGGI